MELLSPDEIRKKLRTRSLGRIVHHFHGIDSTNASAMEMLRRGEDVAHGTLVIAESQSAGRGRAGRSWHSEPGNGLYMSLVLRGCVEIRNAPLLTLAAAVAMHDAAEHVAGVEVDIKWPNDLLAGGRKICGILAEAHAEPGTAAAYVVGIGLNVNHSGFPMEISGFAASLRMVSGRPQSRIEVLAVFLEKLESLLDVMERDGPVGVIAAWQARSSFAFGRRITIRDGDRTVSGMTCGLNDFGALCVRTDSGKIETIYSGDMVFFA